MTRTELENEIWSNLGYLQAKTPTDYQQHLHKLNDSEVFNLWLTIHNQLEAHNHEH